MIAGKTQCSWVFAEKAPGTVDMYICAIQVVIVAPQRWTEMVTKYIGSNGKYIYWFFNGLWSRKPYDAVVNKVYLMEIKPLWIVERFFPFQFGMPK